MSLGVTHLGFWGIVAGLAVFLYVGWRYTVLFMYHLVKIDKDLVFRTQQFFDRLVKMLGLSAFAGRLAYIFQYLEVYLQYGFSILPYFKTGGEIVWFSALPWRILRFAEGIDWVIYIIMWTLLSVFWGYKMYMRLAKLSVEEAVKKKLTRMLIVSVVSVLVVGYLTVLLFR